MKYILLSFLLIPLVSFSQYGVLDESFGNGGIVHTQELPQEIDYFNPRSFAIDLQGNIYIMTNYKVENTEMGFVYDNIKLVKYTAEGQLDLSFGSLGFKNITIGDHVTTGIQIVSTRDNSLLILGYHSTQEDLNQEEIFVIKLDLSGDVITEFGNDGLANFQCEDCKAKEVIEMEDGTIYLGGSTPVMVDNIYTDILIAQITPEGNHNLNFGTNGFHYIPEFERNLELEDLEIDEDGNFFILAETHGDGINYLYRMSPLGELLGRNYLSENHHYFNSIISHGDHVYAAGTFEAMKFYLISLNKSDLNFDLNFAEEGQFIYDVTNSFESANKVLVENERLILVGATDHEFALVSTLLNGEIDSEFGENGQTLTDLNFGNFHFPIDSKIFNDRLIAVDGNDLSLACYKIYAGLSVEDISADSKIQIAPNPTSNSFIINGINGDQNQVQIVDLTGKIIQEFQSVQNKQTLNLGSIPKGNYIIKINSKYKTETKKLIVK